LYAEQLVRNWSQAQQPLPLLILIDNRPPSGEGKFEPQIKSAEHIIISTAKKGNITAPLQLAARKLLRDPLFSFDLKLKVPSESPLPIPKLNELPAPSTAPNPATIAAAAAATTSSTARATPASWNAKKSSSAVKLDSSSSELTVPQPLSRTSRSTANRKVTAGNECYFCIFWGFFLYFLVLFFFFFLLMSGFDLKAYLQEHPSEPKRTPPFCLFFPCPPWQISF
jgi:hypothetical protein